MISVLIEGRLRGDPIQRVTAKGDKFVTAQVRTRAADGMSVLVSVIAFAGAVRDALAGLTEGDALTVTGPASLTAWIGRDGGNRAGLKMTATKILTIYQADGRHGADNLATGTYSHGQGVEHGN